MISSISDYILKDTEIQALIRSIDLTPVVQRLVKVDLWPLTSAIRAVEQYKKFLFLKKKYGKTHTLPPSLDIDECWHHHILNTKQYFQDCMTIFGEYLHHTPSHSDEINQEKLNLLFEQETQSLYCKEFGDFIYEIKPLSYKNLIINGMKNIKTFFKNRFVLTV